MSYNPFVRVVWVVPLILTFLTFLKNKKRSGGVKVKTSGTTHTTRTNLVGRGPKNTTSSGFVKFRISKRINLLRLLFPNYIVPSLF
jgi:hypothetical protein